MEIKVCKAISKRIRTSKDLGDFYAYIERWGDDYTYSFATSEQDRIDDLIDEIVYTAGVFDFENVKRIMGVGLC